MNEMGCVEGHVAVNGKTEKGTAMPRPVNRRLDLSSGDNLLRCLLKCLCCVQNHC